MRKRKCLTNCQVVPRAGTWIETGKIYGNRPFLSSFPVRERGLKLAFLSTHNQSALSFPVWERGLKPLDDYVEPLPITVVPRVGTWIETVSF